MIRTAVTSLRDLLAIADTGTWGTEGDPMSGSPVLRSTNIADYRLDLNEVAWRKIPLSHHSTKRLEAGDILVTASSGSPEHIGKCSLFEEPEDGRSYYFSNFTMRLRVHREKADPRWLYHWLKSDRGRASLSALNSTTTGLRNLSKNLYLSQKLSVPSLAEQRRIAAVLDEADAVRRKRRESLRLLDELLRSAFLEMFGDPVSNEKGWEVVRLGQIADFCGGGTPSRATPDYFTGTICWATSKDFLSEEMLDTQEHLTPQAIENSATSVVPPGTILVVVKSKILMHRLPVAVTRVAMSFSQDVKAITVRDRGIPAVYLARHLRVGQQALLHQARGANTEGLTLEHLRDYRVMIPALPMLHRWEAIESKCTSLRLAATEHASMSVSLFDSLAQGAFRGEL